jgi:hypothetical protein
MPNSVYKYDLRLIRQFDSVYVNVNAGARVTLEADFFDETEAQEFHDKALALLKGESAAPEAERVADFKLWVALEPTEFNRWLQRQIRIRGGKFW